MITAWVKKFSSLESLCILAFTWLVRVSLSVGLEKERALVPNEVLGFILGPVVVAWVFFGEMGSLNHHPFYPFANASDYAQLLRGSLFLALLFVPRLLAPLVSYAGLPIAAVVLIYAVARPQWTTTLTAPLLIFMTVDLAEFTTFLPSMCASLTAAGLGAWAMVRTCADSTRSDKTS